MQVVFIGSSHDSQMGTAKLCGAGSKWANWFDLTDDHNARINATLCTFNASMLGNAQANNRSARVFVLPRRTVQVSHHASTGGQFAKQHFTDNTSLATLRSTMADSKTKLSLELDRVIGCRYPASLVVSILHAFSPTCEHRKHPVRVWRWCRLPY